MKDGPLTTASRREDSEFNLLITPAGLLEARLRGNPLTPSTGLDSEMKRAQKHTRDTAPRDVLAFVGVKPDPLLERTTVGCPMMLAGVIRGYIEEAIELDLLRKQKKVAK